MPNIHHELLIGVSADKVYSAITHQEGLSGWWTPGTEAKPECDSIARFPFGPEYFKEMKITELNSSRLVKWICITAVDEWVGTTISFELQSGDKKILLSLHPELEDQIRQQKNDDEGTLLIFHHDDWKEYTPMFAECNYTWARFLVSLKLFCETGKGRPWPGQHQLG
ncbi:MAG: SRPBCC domain-containing protein [Ferruginibacter sp.]